MAAACSVAVQSPWMLLGDDERAAGREMPRRWLDPQEPRLPWLEAGGGWEAAWGDLVLACLGLDFSPYIYVWLLLEKV